MRKLLIDSTKNRQRLTTGKQRRVRVGYIVMENDILKRQMMNLWKETFHDSDEYIQLVFDAYFDPDFVEYEERDGRVIASLIAIPYTFGNDNYAINSVYLCGLSTYSKYRKEGIMTRLLQNIEKKMLEKGFALMFLIPANSGLRRYYHDRGFLNGFYRSVLHYTGIHDFRMEFHASIMREEKALYEVKKRYFDHLEVKIFNKKNLLPSSGQYEKMVKFILECEQEQRGFSLFQSKGNLEIVLKEAIVSNGKIGVCYNADDEISGIGVYNENETEIIETGRYSKNYASLCKLREKLLSSGEGRAMTIYQYGYEKSHNKSTWNPFTSAVLPEVNQIGAVGTIERVYNPNSHSEVYGMVRILSISEILKFQAANRKDLKYSILMRQENTGNILEFSAKNGKLRINEIIKYSAENDKEKEENKNKRKMYIGRDKDGYDIMILNEKDLGELLFRRPGTDRLVEEAFGIPPLNGKISLLLD